MVPLEGRAARDPFLNSLPNMGLREKRTAMETGRRESGRRAWAVLLPSLTYVAYVPVAGTSWFVVVLLGAGTVAVFLVLGLFLAGERYRRPPKHERCVGFVEARLAARDQLSSLAPKVLLLAEKERYVYDRLESGALGGETWRVVERMRREISTTRFWRRFVAASALIEEDPARAYEELRCLASVAKEVFEKLCRIEEIIESDPSEKGGDGERE
jgi:hypothetical protein